MRSFLIFGAGVLVGAFCMLQLKENESSCCKRVRYGVRDELVDAVGPVGGTLFDGLNVGAIAPQLLDLFGVPYDA